MSNICVTRQITPSCRSIEEAYSALNAELRGRVGVVGVQILEERMVAFAAYSFSISYVITQVVED